MSAILDINNTEVIIKKMDWYSKEETTKISELLKTFNSITNVYNGNNSKSITYINQILEQKLMSIIKLHNSNINVLRKTVQEYRDTVKQNIHSLGGIK